MATGRKLSHHDFGIDQILGTAETYKSNFQKVLNPWRRKLRLITARNF